MTSVAPSTKQHARPPLANSEDSATSNTENSPNSDTPCFQHSSSPSTASSNDPPPAPISSTRTKFSKDSGPVVKFDNLIKLGGQKRRPMFGRSFSDRRYNSRTPPIAQRNGTGSGGAGQCSTPDMNRWRSSRSSKRSLYASFKFIDDYSPLATKNNSADREEKKNSMPLQPFGNNQSSQRRKQVPPPLPSSSGQDQLSTSGSHHYVRRISMRPSIDSAAQSLDVQCGIGPYRPSCLQKFANKNWMLFWLCWFCAVQGMLVSGLVPSVLSTIERRFNFRAASLGRIMQWYDIGYALSCVPVSYFGGRHSKPLSIGIGLLIMGAGSFIFSLPHIISDTHIYKERMEDIGVCGINRLSTPLPGVNSFNYVQSVDTNQTASCELLREQQKSFFAVILTGTFRFEVLFCFAHLLHGIGATPLFTLGVSYIDENVKPTLSSLYIAIFYTFVIIGPAAGFLVSGAFLRFHTDFLSMEKPIDVMDFDESDPEWVGAWWIGFQIASILLLFAVFPILSFPKALPGALEWQRSRMHRKVVERKSSKAGAVHDTTAQTTRRHSTTTSYGLSSTDPCTSSPPPSQQPQQQQPVSVLMIEEINGTDAKQAPLLHRLMQDLRHMPSSVRRLITNPTYMCITLAASVEGLLIAGLSGFMAKYLERQFNVASSRANMLIGCIMVPVAGLGTLASGYIVKRFRLTCPRTLKFTIAMAVFSLVLSPMFLVLCDPAKLSGVEIPYPTDDVSQTNTTVGFFHGKETFYLKSRCNNHCECLEDEFRPVCGTVNNQQVSFFTSCYAGCPEKYHRTKKIYQNCTCSDGNVVTAGWCESKCSALIGFLVLFAPMCLCTFSIGVPALSVVLRCVDYDERSFALGIQWILIRCIGTIPAPAIFAWFFDISCLKRRKTADNECGITLDNNGTGESDGSCFIYDNKKLADLFLAFTLIGQTLTLIFLILASIFYRSNGREDLIVSEAPPQTPGAVVAGEDVLSGSGTPTRFALEAQTSKDKDGTVKRLS